MTDLPDSLDPSPDAVAELDRLNAACKAAPGDVDAQMELWQAVVNLDRWVFINRGTDDQPRPYSLAAQPGPMLCIYSSATQAEAAARASGLVPEGQSVSLLVVPLPDGIDGVMSMGQNGVVGVTLDYPQAGAWCPLPNLARLKETRRRA